MLQPIVFLILVPLYVIGGVAFARRSELMARLQAAADDDAGWRAVGADLAGGLAAAYWPIALVAWRIRQRRRGPANGGVRP